MKISKIEYVGKAAVINLTVKKNHTFITRNGIPTHNCDSVTPDTQLAIRDFMESVKDITRFVFCANYGYKLIPELKSRCRVIEMVNPPAKDIYFCLKTILKKEGVKHKDASIIEIVKKCYPDIRQSIISLQENINDGVLAENVIVTTNDDINKLVFDAMLTQDPDNVRKVLRSHPIDYTSLYKYLYTLIMDAAGNDVFKKDASAIMLIGEHLHRNVTSGIPEINFLHFYVTLLIKDVI